MFTNNIIKHSIVLKNFIKFNHSQNNSSTSLPTIINHFCNYHKNQILYYPRTKINNKKLILSSLHKFSTLKLTKQQIQKSTYQQLIGKITKLYNYRQYKIPSALSLLEIHHQYKIFKPGDWVLDIGAGPNWSWTDLALKLTHINDYSNKVISNDLKECALPKQNNVCITGNFLQEQIQTKIAMNLIERQVNTILIDATPKFSGNQELDGTYTMQIFIKALQFSQNYLKKGGTIVFKTIQSSTSLQNEKQAKFFFNEVYRYKSTSFRIDSPTFFYVLKGYMMNDNLEGLASLLKQYGNAKNNYLKAKIIEKYKQKYSWDPVDIIRKQAKQNIIKLRKQGKKNKQIAKLYENDPYVKVGEILQLLQKIQNKDTNPIEKLKAQKKLVTGSSDLGIQLPQNQQQFAQLIYKEVQQIARQQKARIQKKKNKKKDKKNDIQDYKVQQKAPLAQNQVYMKTTAVNPQESKDNIELRNYTQQDLYGFNTEDPHKSINTKIVKTKSERQLQDQVQLQKIIKSFPEVKQALKKNNIHSQQDIQKAQQKFIKKLFQDQKLENQQRPMNSQNIQQQFEPSQELFKTKDSTRNAKKYKNLDKRAQVQSNFDFNQSKYPTVQIQKINKQNQQILQHTQDIRESRMEYLKSKPKKVAKSAFQQKSEQKPNLGSYFKKKKKDFKD